jgi:hypothetical protein
MSTLYSVPCTSLLMTYFGNHYPGGGGALFYCYIRRRQFQAVDSRKELSSCFVTSNS